jgi:hypothetical protein
MNKLILLSGLMIFAPINCNDLQQLQERSRRNQLLENTRNNIAELPNTKWCELKSGRNGNTKNIDYESNTLRASLTLWHEESEVIFAASLKRNFQDPIEGAYGIEFGVVRKCSLNTINRFYYWVKGIDATEECIKHSLQEFENIVKELKIKADRHVAEKENLKNEQI